MYYYKGRVIKVKPEQEKLIKSLTRVFVENSFDRVLLTIVSFEDGFFVKAKDKFNNYYKFPISCIEGYTPYYIKGDTISLNSKIETIIDDGEINKDYGRTIYKTDHNHRVGEDEITFLYNVDRPNRVNMTTKNSVYPTTVIEYSSRFSDVYVQKEECIYADIIDTNWKYTFFSDYKLGDRVIYNSKTHYIKNIEISKNTPLYQLDDESKVSPWNIIPINIKTVKVFFTNKKVDLNEIRNFTSKTYLFNIKQDVKKGDFSIILH